MIDEACLEQLNVSSIEKLQEAGQKIVYRALSNEGEDVVVKIIKPNQDLERIFREIDILKNLKEFSTSKILSDGTLTCDGTEYLYIVESYINGMTLRAYLGEHQTLPYGEVCHFLKTMVDVISTLEKNQLIHRDIKPENVMRTEDGEYILIDFGIARDLSKTSLTATSSPRGPATIIYAPIEQIDNEKHSIDSRTDLYSACLVAYEMICGINPFVEGCMNELQVLRKIDKGVFMHLQNAEFSKLLEFIHTNMNKHRTRRARSAKEAKVWFDEIYNELCEGKE